MKVLFLFGGLPHYFNAVLNRLQDHPELEVVVIAPLGKGATLGSGVHEREEGIRFKLIRLPEYKTWYGKPGFRNIYVSIAAEKPDILVSGWPYFLIFLFRPLLTLRLKLKGIALFAREIPFTVPYFNESRTAFSERCVESQKSEAMFTNPIVFIFHKWIRKILYTFVFDSALVYTEKGVGILNSYGLKKEAVTVTYNSPDTEQIEASIKAVKQEYPALKIQAHRILHIGRLVDWKRVDLLIRAVHALRTEFDDIELIIIGKGEEEENLKKLSSDLNLNGIVQFKGALYEGKEQSLEFLQSGIYALAGMGGLSINEAMAHGLPVLCSVADGTEKHLVFEGLNGYYFNDGDLEDLIRVLRMMLHSDLRQMGENSQKIIRDKINIATVTDRFIKAFLE